MSFLFETITKFIRSCYNRPEGLIALHEPRFYGNEKLYVNECIESSFVSSVGKFVDKFETDLATYTGVKRAVVCVNGTSALHLALILVGVKNNDEVLTQPLTFIATTNAIKYCSADPIFVDVDLDTLGMSPDSLLNFLKTNAIIKNNVCYNKISKKRISACIPMHTFGHPCKIDKIVDICKNYNIPVIEDAAESLGSRYKNKFTGSFADIGVISFNGNKIITTGGGGALLFNNIELASLAKHLSTQAKIPHAWNFVHDSVAFNYRMPNLNAALGIAQLEQIEDFIRSKRALSMRYQTFFDEIGINFIKEPIRAYSNYWLNAILLKNKSEKDEFLNYSNQREVLTRPAWELMIKLPMYTQCQHNSLENSLWLADRLVNIPSSVIIDN